eukprot:362917-Chlamydomonas_euryale.AAC.11
MHSKRGKAAHTARWRAAMHSRPGNMRARAGELGTRTHNRPKRECVVMPMKLGVVVGRIWLIELHKIRDNEALVCRVHEESA